MQEIAAIPTHYNGVNFRSRLEARWAALFDMLGWEWEYEPIDLPGWIPDFKIKGTRNLLVEIKPYDISTLPWDELCQYLQDNSYELSPEWIPSVNKIIKSKPELDILILGNGIHVYDEETYDFGIILESDLKWASSVAPLDSIPIVLSRYDIPEYIESQSVWAVKKRAMAMFPQFPQYQFTSLWKRAGNIVQWKKPSKDI